MKELSDLEIQQALELMKQYPAERIEQERLIIETQIQNEALRKQVLEEFTSAALEGTKVELEANERPIKALQNIENAVYKHKDSTDKAIGIHEKQLTELETANQSLNTQVSKLSDTVKLLEKQLQESENQTGELADVNAKLYVQIKEARKLAEDSIQDSKTANRKADLSNLIAFLSFLLALVAIIFN